MSLAENPFKPATRDQSKLRMTLDGPAGAGKTFTALRLATLIARHLGKPVAAIDTERGSMSKYVGKAPDGFPWQFDVVELKLFAPKHYTQLIQTAAERGYGCLVIDSLSHAWEGKGGSLEQKEKYASAQRTHNDWTAWRAVTPEHNAMVDAMLQAPMHIFTTMRSRMDHVQEKDESSGRTVVRKVGMAPIQRPGMEYEFDVICDITVEHVLTISKTRYDVLDGWSGTKPGPELAGLLLAELEVGK